VFVSLSATSRVGWKDLSLAGGRQPSNRWDVHLPWRGGVQAGLDAEIVCRVVDVCCTAAVGRLAVS